MRRPRAAPPSGMTMTTPILRVTELAASTVIGLNMRTTIKTAAIHIMTMKATRPAIIQITSTTTGIGNDLEPGRPFPMTALGSR